MTGLPVNRIRSIFDGASDDLRTCILGIVNITGAPGLAEEALQFGDDTPAVDVAVVHTCYALSPLPVEETDLILEVAEMLKQRSLL